MFASGELPPSSDARLMTVEVTYRRVSARAQEFHERAAQQLSDAKQAKDDITRNFYSSAAEAYIRWATELEKIALTIGYLDERSRGASQ